MHIDPKHDLARSRWSRRTGQIIDMVCLAMLGAVMVTVIYAFSVRAIWAHGYFVAVAIAIIGALVLLIGLAQQAIAARDAATWRSMAIWQVRAAQQKVTGLERPGSPEWPPMLDHGDDPYSHEYYEHLVDVVLESLQRANEDMPKP